MGDATDDSGATRVSDRADDQPLSLAGHEAAAEQILAPA